MKIEKLVIYGCGGHARSVASVALLNNITSLIFVDENAKEQERLYNFPVLPHLDSNDFPCLVAIGDNQRRSQVFSIVEKKTKHLYTLIAKDSSIGINAELSDGCFVGCGSYVGPQSKIGKNTIVNTHCIIEHDCQIGSHSHISINATIAGKCRIGDYVMVGAGATVIDNIQICDNVIVGAGAVVVSDIIEPGTYVGIPARRI